MTDTTNKTGTRKTTEKPTDPSTASARAVRANTWEVLTRTATGREVLHRVDAADAAAARDLVRADLPYGTDVLDVAAPGTGLGSHPQPEQSRGERPSR